MRKYKCINEMMIEVVDGDGAIIDNELLNFEDDRYSWIEMPYEDLEKHFEELL